MTKRLSQWLSAFVSAIAAVAAVSGQERATAMDVLTAERWNDVATERRLSVSDPSLGHLSSGLLGRPALQVRTGKNSMLIGPEERKALDLRTLLRTRQWGFTPEAEAYLGMARGTSDIELYQELVNQDHSGDLRTSYIARAMRDIHEAQMNREKVLLSDYHLYTVNEYRSRRPEDIMYIHHVPSGDWVAPESAPDLGGIGGRGISSGGGSFVPKSQGNNSYQTGATGGRYTFKPDKVVTVSIAQKLFANPARARDLNEWRYSKYAGAVYSMLNDSSFAGSAVYLGNGYFATANHVMLLAKGNEANLRPVSPDGRRLATVKFKIVPLPGKESTVTDLAIFKVTPIGVQTVDEVFSTPTISMDALAPGRELTVAGFPGTRGIYEEYTDNLVVQHEPDWTPVAAHERADLFYVGWSDRGNSGSGIFDETTGALIGIFRQVGVNKSDYDSNGDLRILLPSFDTAFRGVSIREVIKLRDAQVR